MLTRRWTVWLAITITAALLQTQKSTPRSVTSGANAVSQSANGSTGSIPGASISGRVTLDGSAAPGILVILARKGSGLGNTPVARIRSDQNGLYRFLNLDSGNYELNVDGLSRGAATYDGQIPTVLLDSGQNAQGIDFALARAGVITGRVIDSAGRPLVRAVVRAEPQDNDIGLGASGLTDDRGVYRIFGIQPGRYRVSAGFGFSDKNKSFYRDTDTEKPAIVQVQASAKAANVNITYVSPPSLKGYSISGRVVYADSGDAVSGVYCSATSSDKAADNKSGHRSFGRGTSDSRGYFRMDGMPPGTYSLSADGAEQGGYSDNVSIDVPEGYVSGVEIKYHRGGSISGKLVVEGTDDPAILRQLADVHVFTTDVFSQQTVDPDGSFRITGLRPGIKTLSVIGGGGHFTLDRLAFDEADTGGTNRIPSVNSTGRGFELGPDESVTGLTLFLVYCNGSIKGQIKIVGGKLPPYSLMKVLLDPPPGRQVGYALLIPGNGVEPDFQGRFAINNLKPGEHHVTLLVTGAPSQDKADPLGIVSVSQDVVVTNDSEVQVTLVLDLSGMSDPNDL